MGEIQKEEQKTQMFRYKKMRHFRHKDPNEKLEENTYYIQDLLDANVVDENNVTIGKLTYIFLILGKWYIWNNWFKW